MPKESVTITGTYLATFDDAVLRSVTAHAGVGGLSFANGTSGAESEKILVIAVRSTTVTVWPIPVVDDVAVVQGVATTFDVLTNDQTLADVVGFSRTQLTSVPRPIGAAAPIVPAAPIFGSITCSDSGSTRGFCTYQSAALFLGTDHFDYSVSQLGRSWNVHVTVLVIPASAAPTARSDRAVATTGGASIAVTPLANDVGEAGGTLTIVSVGAVSADRGTLACSPHSCTFTPPTSGFVGTIVAEYLVADESSTGIFSATSTGLITIYVDAAALMQQGFTSSPRTEPTVDAGAWTDTSAMQATVATCVSGRPVTIVAWAANARATSWTLERREVIRAAGAEWTPIAVLPGAATSFRDDRVGESNDFQYRIRPDRYRWEGAFSDVSPVAFTPDAVSAAGC